jgi:hypothetical protein
MNANVKRVGIATYPMVAIALSEQFPKQNVEDAEKDESDYSPR